MDVVLQYLPGCPNWTTTLGYLEALGDEGLAFSLSVERIDDAEAAEDRGFAGSPTILINGLDSFVDGPPEVAFACRLYDTERGPSGSPSLKQLREALLKAFEDE